jgi:hypothetical protein
MTWTVSVAGDRCGACHAHIRPDEPMLLRIKQLKRCAACAAAAGYPVNEQEVDLERVRLEQERGAAHTDRSTSSSHVRRQHFDAKSLAANDRD